MSRCSILPGHWLSETVRMRTRFEAVVVSCWGAGSPSDRLRPAYALVKKACAQQDKGARCFDTAATFHPLGEGTPAARAQDRAIDCGFDKATKGLSLLADADEAGSEIEDEAG